MMALKTRDTVVRIAAILALTACLPACKPPPKVVEKPTPAAAPAPEIPKISAPELAARLAGAWIDSAQAKLAEKRPDEALALLVSALRADPASVEAHDLEETILRETVWNFPVLTLDHRLPIDQIARHGSSLWVSLGGDANTTVRWDLTTLRIESVLFPAPSCATRSLTFDPAHRWVVVERGAATLICDAQTLKPIRQIGEIPRSLTSAAVVVFSADGLLMAHPAESNGMIVWHLRDVATGEVLRSSDPVADAPIPVAAQLDRQRLRVLRADGSLWEMPVSPVEEIHITPPESPVQPLQAQFALNGNSALISQEPAPHEPPILATLMFGKPADDSLEMPARMQRFPWSRQPNAWSGLAEIPGALPFEVEENLVKMSDGERSPVATTSPVSAAAFDEQSVITASENGVVTFSRWLPLPSKIDKAAAGELRGSDSLAALEKLTVALAGTRYDEESRAFTAVTASDRAEAMAGCDLTAIGEIFPALDFHPLAESMAALPRREVEPSAFLPLWERLARADPTRKSWPKLLKISKDLIASAWHRDLTAAVAGEVDSPLLAPAKLDGIFQADDASAVEAAITASGKKGAAAAAALALALKFERPEWIEACLTQDAELPPVLKQIALSRIAWLQGRKADALSPWPEDFPEMAEIRAREDWDGWEQADFNPALDTIHQYVTDELAAIQVPENATPEQRKAVADRLADPATIATVGKRRFAAACLNAALAFSAHKEDAKTTFSLAKTARDLGAQPEPCLRAEALALTALGDYENAHPRWIELLTEHPVETTIPGDYAEGAYTAFENSDPRQAMEILTTGMHRFPTDGNFALRAGWVALLTGNPDRAYQFLLTGSRIGFPEEKVENATALLTIAAAQSGAMDDASVYFQDLLKIDPAWGDVTTLDTLDWPVELKIALAQFMDPSIRQDPLPAPVPTGP